jgi:hypothetical protein
LDIDGVLIQEPYVLPSLSPVVANIPPGFTAFHQLSDDYSYGAAILIRDSIVSAGKPVCMHISNSAACVELTTNNGPLRLSSVYIRPSIVDFSATTLTILEALSAPFSIIGADANARSRMWDSPFNDKRGSDLESLLTCSNLRVVNQPHSELDFVPAGTSFGDLTLAGDKVCIHSWFFLDTPSLSDHPYIF